MPKNKWASASWMSDHLWSSSLFHDIAVNSSVFGKSLAELLYFNLK